jgi:tRNA A37 threonylcarbamoyladenosine dehydratase
MAIVTDRRAFRPRPTDLDRDSFAPRIYDPALPAHRDKVLSLADAGAVVVDALSDQLDELVATRNPARELGPDARRAAARAHIGDVPPELYGRWVYYPWSSRLVHLLGPDEFFLLRTDRNRNKITADEQRTLRQKTICVVGLSVGQASAVTLSMEGVGGRFRLADFDTLSLSNMNRLRASVADIGLKKTHLAARQMFEIDPYLDIRIWPDGLSPASFDEFLLEDGKADLLVEECDDLYLKIAIREYARDNRIPVLMETSDRGLLEIERFDLEPERPILHGLMHDVRADDLRKLTTKEKVPYVLRIHDEQVFSPRLRGSLVEVKESIYTWPQLASAVTLGGSVVTDAARRILLGAWTESGRFSVDLEQLVGPKGAVRIPAPRPIVQPVAEEAQRPRQLKVPEPPAGGGPPTLEEVRFLVECAALAPSAGNSQPWQFQYQDGLLEARIDPKLMRSVLHYGEPATLVAFGAAAENVAIGARALGLELSMDAPLRAGAPALVFSVRLRRDGRRDDARLRMLQERVTNRRYGDDAPLGADAADALLRAARDAGGDLVLVTERTQREELAEILGRGDQAMLLSRPLHRELIAEIRWSPEEVTSTRTGIDLASLELTPTDAAAFRVLADWSTLKLIRDWGGGQALRKSAREALRASCAVALVRARGSGRRAYFDGGVVVQRVWHEATELRLAAQPWSALVFLFQQLEDPSSHLEIDRLTRASLSEVKRDFGAMFPSADGFTDVFLLRLACAAPPTARSIRKPVDDVLTFGRGR